MDNSKEMWMNQKKIKEYLNFGLKSIEKIDQIVNTNKNIDHIFFVSYYSQSFFDHFQIVQYHNNNIYIYQAFQNMYYIKDYLRNIVKMEFNIFLHYLYLFLTGNNQYTKEAVQKLFALTEAQSDLLNINLFGRKTISFFDITACRNPKSKSNCLSCEN